MRGDGIACTPCATALLVKAQELPPFSPIPGCRMGRSPFFALGAALLATAGPSAAEPPPVAVMGGLVRTQTDAGEVVGTVVIQGGKVVAVGRDAAIPPGAVRIDATGCVVAPGLIDARGTLGLNAAAAREGGREATLDVLDAVDPFADDWRDAARQGITAVYVQPSGSGALGGAGAVLKVAPGDVPAAKALRAAAGLQAALGNPPTAPRQEAPELPFLGRRGGPPGLVPATPQPEAPPPANN